MSAYLARFTGSSREHTQSDLRCYMRWCADRGLDPLAARRPDLKQYIRWMQETCRFKPSTISRRFSVAAGFYRTCVIDGVLQHSPADHVRRPNVPPESPTLGFTHLQFEALLTAALAIAVRRRRNELAVLRVLGMTRRQSRMVVTTQATVLALIGLAFDVPLGIALGRTLWRAVADGTPLAYHPPFAAWALLLVGPLALMAVNLLAAWPGQRAARLRTGHVLRAE